MALQEDPTKKKRPIEEPAFGSPETLVQGPPTAPVQGPQLPPGGMPPVAGPAPGSALYKAPVTPPQGQAPPSPVQAPAMPSPQEPQSFQDVSGIDPNAPIRQFQQAQKDQAAATTDMTAAMNTPISPIRGILGAAVGAGIGALSPPNAQGASQLGSSIATAPRDKAMGLAAQRAAQAKASSEGAKDLGTMTNNAQTQFTDERAENRQGDEFAHKQGQDAAAAVAAGNKLQSPTQVGTKIVQTFESAGPGGVLKQPLELGDAPVRASDTKVDYKTDAQGNLLMLSVDLNGQLKTTQVMDDQGQPVMMAPNEIAEFTTFIQNYRAANPTATPAMENQAILDYRKSGATSIDLEGIRNARTDEENVKTTEIVSNINRNPAIIAARESGDPNAYTRAYEALLAQIGARSPDYAKFVPAAREQLRSNAPKVKQGGSLAEDFMKSQQQQPQPR